LNSELYPFQSRFFDRGGLKLHYIDEGSGEPVVMVHGNPSWSLYYRELAKALRGSHRVVALDHIGMGLSDKPGDEAYEYTLKSRVDDLEALLEERGLKGGLTLVLHDWGGMIGMAYACRHPERVKRLVILNTAAFLLPQGRSLPWALRLSRTPLGAFLIRGFNAFSLAATYVGCLRRPMSGELRRAYVAPYDSWANRIATLRFVQDIPLRSGDKAYALVREVEESLHRLSEVPMLLCWGGKDFVFDAHFLAEWRRRFPKAEVHFFPEAGHYVLEDAAEEIIPLVRFFLAK
jgi:haloalkane dehalogenase